MSVNAHCCLELNRAAEEIVTRWRESQGRPAITSDDGPAGDTGRTEDNVPTQPNARRGAKASESVTAIS